MKRAAVKKLQTSFCFAELEQEIETFKRENARVLEIKKKLTDEKKKFTKEMEDFKKIKEEDKKKIEEERRRIRREKLVFEKNQREAQNQLKGKSQIA